MSHRRSVAIAVVLALVAAVAGAVAIRGFGRDEPPPPAIEGLAHTPPLGWNSWNAFGCAIGEDRIERAADAMVSSGMRDAGYRYILVDDCWFHPERDAAGHIRENPLRFPHGMKALADYIHQRGLLFGLYESPTDRTCAQVGGSYPGRTGSRGHERDDAQTFAAWGVDYLKYDWCGSNVDVGDLVDAFTTMRDALRATGRPIFYSINPNSGAYVPPSEFGRFDGVATMTRVSHDVIPAWDTINANTTSQGVMDALENATQVTCAPNAGFFCDYDMLTIGSPQVAGIYLPSLNEAEQRTQLALWSIWGSPLIAGNDLTRMPPAMRDLLTNREVIAIDQDSSLQRAVALPESNGGIWTRALSDGSTAIAIVNRDNVPMPFAAGFPSLGLARTDQFDVLDVFSGKRAVQTRRYATTVAPHDTVLLRVKPVS